MVSDIFRRWFERLLEFHWIVMNQLLTGAEIKQTIPLDHPIIVTHSVIYTMSNPVVFKTEYSTYELDEENRLFRRLHGKNPATGRQGNDGDWRQYVRILHPLEVGKPFAVVWEIEDGQDENVRLKMTETSPVTGIGESAIQN